MASYVFPGNLNHGTHLFPGMNLSNKEGKIHNFFFRKDIEQNL